MWSKRLNSPERPGLAILGFYFPHLTLAASFGLKGELDEAKALLAAGIKIRPEFNSLARLRAYTTWGNAQFRALRESTLEHGLRRAGMPDE